MILRFINSIILTLSLFQIFAAAQAVKEARHLFTTADAPWMLTLDGKNFHITDQQIKHDNKSAYFLMYNEKEKLTVSLFIEPAVKCKSSSECSEFVWKTGNPQWGELQNVVHSKIGDVSYFEFYRPTVQNQPVQMLDMYAQFVENGYWVDLHISKVLYKKEEHSLFENFVKSVKFVSKTAEASTDWDKSFKSAQKALEDWSLLWDSGKHKESYTALANFSKSKFDEKLWATHWTGARKPFGKLKWRKLINATLTTNMTDEGKNSGQALAEFNFHSSFENEEAVFEKFILILEKDGKWRVGGYYPND